MTCYYSLSERGFWLVVPRWKFASTNQKHYPGLGSEMTSVWILCSRSSDVISCGNVSYVSVSYDVRVKRAMCAADSWTDYWLDLGKYKLRIPPTRRPQGQNAAAMLNSFTLKSSHDAEVQSRGLEGRLLVLPQDGQDNIEERWAALCTLLYCIWKTLTSNPQKSGLVPDRWDW